jgi:hypothetical protein
VAVAIGEGVIVGAIVGVPVGVLEGGMGVAVGGGVGDGPQAAEMADVAPIAVSSLRNFLRSSIVRPSFFLPVRGLGIGLLSPD